MNDTEKQFDFSVVMAVYNVEEYLREAVQSLEQQTIGFSRIQLILVDDGSTDGSGKICDEYREKHPDNVLVIHKENGRQASARNAGLPYVQGRYVNFMDSDDKMDPDAFEKVMSFMDHAGKEANVCCIPIFFFGKVQGPHMLNNKFERGTRVVNLLERENSDCVLLHASSVFYRADVVNRICFDTSLYIAEDAKYTLQVLLEKPILGIVSNTRYLYRKHGNSTLDKSLKQANSYVVHLQNFTLWIINAAERKYNTVPLFVQYALMYELQWKLRQAQIPYGVLTEPQKETYKSLFLKVLVKINDEIILEQKYLEPERKFFALLMKYGCSPEVSIQRKKNAVQNDIWLKYGKTTAAKVSEMRTIWEFLKINEKRNECTIEGHHIVSGLDGHEAVPFLVINGKKILCEVVSRPKESALFLGEPICRVVGFRCELSIGKEGQTIVPGIQIDGVSVVRKNCHYGSFFPVCDTYKNAYALTRNWAITQKNGAVSIRFLQNPSPLAAVLEFGFLREIWNKNLLGGRKAVAGRLWYHLVKPFKRRKLWIISDRINKADDNGEALFCYLMKHKPDNTRIVFAVRKDSPDYRRMSKAGECVNAMSFHYKLLHLLCDVNISSHADGFVVNPFWGHHDALRDLLVHQKYVFLQHGITQEDISGWINRYKKDMSGVIASAIPEYNSFLHYDYGYTEKKVWLTGFPRFDRLYHDERKLITIMPTWRKNLFRSVDVKSGLWSLDGNFVESSYYRFYNELLNSELLLDCLQRKGYRMQFFPHPTIQPFADKFHHNKNVTFLPASISYTDVYARSNLVVTDYSSAVFDFAYLRKPVLYCQFDKDSFLSGEHIGKEGYFDYERDGFGEVSYTLEDTVNLICEYLENDCRLKEKYRKRIDSFFAYNDRNNCRRVTEKILNLEDNRTQAGSC